LRVLARGSVLAGDLLLCPGVQIGGRVLCAAAIRSCKDRRTADFLANRRVPEFQALERQAMKAVAKLQAVSRLVELRNPPSNRFEALGGDRKGQVNTAFGSMTDGGFVLAGNLPSPRHRDWMNCCRPASLTVSRSSTITEGETMSFDAIDNLPPIHPGEILKDELDCLSMSARKFAHHIGVPANAVTSILNGTRGISAQMALRVGKAFGTGPHYWMALQDHYAEKQARQELGNRINEIGELVSQKVA
jgi:addiction module HigA family antidote